MAEHAVLGDEGRGGAMGDHEARVEASVGDEKGGEARQRRVAQPLDAPLRDARELRCGDREEVERLGLMIEKRPLRPLQPYECQAGVDRKGAVRLAMAYRVLAVEVTARKDEAAPRHDAHRV